jgi:hypothetical protein
MLIPELADESDDGTVFRDVITLALLGFVSVVILLLPHINPPTQAAEPTTVPGNLVVEVRWPDEVDADVDLWVEAPGDRPVGYSNKGGRIFNLLRDDLGRTGDATGLNYEIAYSRGAPAGEYTVNLHLYRNSGGTMPVPAVVAVTLKRSADAPGTPLASKRVELGHVGEEATVVRFALDDKAALVPGSLHDLPRPLRTAKR